jgi:hypothetical protein
MFAGNQVAGNNIIPDNSATASVQQCESAKAQELDGWRQSGHVTAHWAPKHGGGLTYRTSNYDWAWVGRDFH